MKSKNPKYKVVAEAVRMEHNLNTNEHYVTFKILDEQFKQKLREEWNNDLELKVIGKSLVKE